MPKIAGKYLPFTYDCANCKFKMKECIKQEKLMDLDDDFMKIASNKFMIQMI